MAHSGLKVRSQYIFDHDMKTLRVMTFLRGRSKGMAVVQHRYRINPTFRLKERDANLLVFANAGVQVRIESEGLSAKVRRDKESCSVFCNFSPGKVALSTFELSKA